VPDCKQFLIRPDTIDPDSFSVQMPVRPVLHRSIDHHDSIWCDPKEIPVIELMDIRSKAEPIADHIRPCIDIGDDVRCFERCFILAASDNAPAIGCQHFCTEPLLALS
jgi:hypothetical protein